MKNKISSGVKKPIIIIIVIMLAVLAGGCSISGKGEAGKKPDDGTKAASPATGAAPGAAPKIIAENKTEVIKSDATPAAIAEIAKYQYTRTYANSTYNFSFKYPNDFTTSEIPGDGSDVVLVQNIAKDIGAQVIISPFDGGEIDLTAESIKAEIPELKVSQPQEVLIGPNRKGLAFMSDNQAFGGASREVWFVFNGQLYQISTYAEFDGFLRGLFGTWEFVK